MFLKKPIWVRCIILLAGAFANVLTAWLALMLIVGCQQTVPMVEKIHGKPVFVDMEVLLHRLVFIAFCLILVQLLLNDA